MTHDDARSAKAPFSGLLPFAVSGYSFLAVAKSTAGRRTRVTQWRHQTRHASFLSSSSCAPIFRARFYAVAVSAIMVARAGQLSGWPVFCGAGFYPRLGHHP
ncbi:ash family protein [Klebsiella pneumoniae]|nr:ash family protein [Klebsiella pneumoniae]